MIVNRTRIVIVDSNDNARKVYKLIVEGTDKYIVVNSYATLEAAAANVEVDRPDLLIFDPADTEVEEFSLLRRMSIKLEDFAILIYSNILSEATVINLFSYKISGYILKDNDRYFTTLLGAIDHLHNNYTPLSPKVAKILLRRLQLNQNSPLSARETEVLKELSQGKSQSKIAKNLKIGRETVKSHVKNAYAKMQVHRKFEAIERARQEQWI